MMLLFKWTFLSKHFTYYYLLITILQKKKLTLRGGGGGKGGGNFSSLRNARVNFFYHFIISFK